MKKISLLSIIFIISLSTLKAQNDTMYIMRNGIVLDKYIVSEIDSIIFYRPTIDIVIDVDGNEYNTITIDNQVWLAENLKTTKYNDGTPIPHIADNGTWNGRSLPGYCWYENDFNTYGEVYGALYNWHTINTGKLCPTGWHVPTDEEWGELTEYLGGGGVAGGKLKETGSIHWISPNTGATNDYGFTALPGGYRDDNGSFATADRTAFWWSSTELNSANAFYRKAEHNDDNLYRSNTHKSTGFSVRCIMN